MGTPVPSRIVEDAARGAGPLTVTTIDRLDPRTREELIKKYGIKLKGEEEQMEAIKPTEESNVPELTKEKYLEHKAAGMTDSEIRKKYGFKFPNDLTMWKKRNGVEGVRLAPTPEQRIDVSDKPDQQKQSEETVLNPENGVEERIRYLEKALKAANQARLEAEARLEQAQREGSALSVLLDKLNFFEIGTEDLETAMQIVKEIEAADLDFELYRRFGRYVVSYSKLAGRQHGEVE